jgi:benzoyl-CoA reductase subunit C
MWEHREYSMSMNFRDLYENRLDIIREYKEKNGCLTIGTFCSYVPVEILHSFGIVPVRIWGKSENIHRADTLLQTFICPPARHLMALGLDGSYDFLNGIVHCYTCDATCGLYNIWVRNLNPEFSHLISLPYTAADEALAYSMIEFGNFIEKIEPFTGKKFSAENLKRSIKLYNDARSLLKKVYSFKKSGFPASYSDIFSMNLCFQTLPVEMIISGLSAYTCEVEKKERASGQRLKIMISGSVVSDLPLIDFIEESGGEIVADDTCIGLRLLEDIALKGDPLESLAGYYLTRPPCSSKADFPARKASFLETIADYDIDAVIFIHQKFCDPHLSDYPFLKKILDEKNIPHLQFELESDGFTGGIKTRIESFFEMLER